ncbi:hypothetical protein XENORESO_000547 [Xenotaenia resolanae]|uniref:Secreted protein n=1 Tax=Xenotaenia resolanae TaxID=208358 RepID=A0ABV0VY87_9TELE
MSASCLLVYVSISSAQLETEFGAPFSFTKQRTSCKFPQHNAATTTFHSGDAVFRVMWRVSFPPHLLHVDQKVQLWSHLIRAPCVPCMAGGKLAFVSPDLGSVWLKVLGRKKKNSL